MVRVYRKTHEYQDSPPTALLAFFLRYPNPFARHVLSCDVLSRRIDPETGRLHTTRLILKKGIVPRWAQDWIPGTGRGRLEAWVLEESVVDPPAAYDDDDDHDKTEQRAESSSMANARERTMRERHASLVASTKNISFKKMLHIIEGAELYASPKGGTTHLTTAHVESDWGGGWSGLIRNRIESWGVGKFERNTETARQGMSLILMLLRTHQPLPSANGPAEVEFGKTWAAPAEGGTS